MKNQKGITLVALIITIIVMLILAGVALAFSIGEEGVLIQAQNSVNTTKNEEIEENVLLAWSACKNEYLASNKSEEESAYFTKEKLNANLSEGEVSDVIYNSNGDSEVIYKLDGKYYKVQITLTGIGTVVGEPTETPIQPTLLSQIDETNYGDYVNYEVDLGIVTKGLELSDGKVPKTDWRIFYADANNVFLIASDYLPASKFPNGVFGGIKGQYSGYWVQNSKDATKITTSGSITANNSFLFEGLSKVRKTHINYQAVSTLLDSNKWNSLAKIGYVDNIDTSVIGSPTVEMWIASWNAKYDDTLAFNTTITGYNIGLTSENLSSSIYVKTKPGYNDSLYYPHEDTSLIWNDCVGYWLAAPSAGNVKFMMFVSMAGYVNPNDYNCEYYGVRPVVCLKSGITATQDENKVWQLGE